MKKKNKLDEMQEQKLLHIEKNGCWFAFWALLASMFIQMAIFGGSSFREIAGEWIIFMILALYLSISCMKNGIWDRRLEPSPKTNLLVSVGSAIGFGVIFAIVNYFNYKNMVASVATFIIFAIVLFVGIYLALTVSTMLYKKRVHDIENAFDEEEEHSER